MVSCLPSMIAVIVGTYIFAGYDDYQIYLLLSCAPVQGHVAGIVDIPNACTTSKFLQSLR